MRATLSLSSDVYYHGTDKKFAQFSEYRPAFFTKNIHYAQEYGKNLIKARLDIRLLFDTRTDRRAVDIYNNHFLKSGLAPRPSASIKLGAPVHTSDADELWSYLCYPDYPPPHYDGILVSEGDMELLHEKFNGANVSYVPLFIKQIHVVR